MISVLITDDHAIVCAGLAQVLASSGDIRVDAIAASGAEALTRLRQAPVDLVLLDMSLPGMNGIETLKQIKLEHPDLPVLMLSMHPAEQYAVRCIKAGAAGYLTKACDKKVLLEAVRTAANGSKYLTPEVSQCLLNAVQQTGETAKPHEMLSDREHEVFMLIARGVPLAGMARQMSLSPKTVSTYRARILEKTGLASNAELMRYAFDHGLL
jgi:two-component system, NarL family, invasion response regulator UvrY